MRRAHGVRAALRLCARHRRDPHPSRQPHRPDRGSPGRCSRELRDRWAGRIALQASPLFAIDLALDDRAHGRRDRPTVAAHGSVTLGAVTYACPRAARRGSTGCSALAGASAAGTSTSMSTRRSSPPPRSLRAIARDGARARLRGPHPRAAIAARSRSQPDDEARGPWTSSREAGIAIVVAADVQHVPAGPRRRPHAALARRDAAARDAGARRPGLGRLRQHARPVLRLWRPRHGRGLPRGDAHRPSRPSGRRLARAPSPPPRPPRWASTDGRIAVGGPADLVLFRARTWTELLSRPQSDRTVLRDGQPIDPTLPDYRELDAVLAG